MKKVVKIGIIFLTSILSLSVIAGFSFYRADIPIEKLEPDFFTEHSSYLNVEIFDLNSEPISINIHYQDKGNVSDPVIILLHGMFASSHTFEPWMNMLNQDGYRFISIDLPNHGLSGNFSDNIVSQRRSAAIVKAVLDHLHISSGVIGGNSMGGGVSWYFTSEYHQQGFLVEGLVLIDAVYPVLDASSGNSPGLIQTLLTSPFKHLLSQMTPKFLLRLILNQVYGSANQPNEDAVNRYYKLLRKEGSRSAIVNSQFEIESGITGFERLQRIRDFSIPTFVMWGKEDRWISVDVAHLFQSALDLPNHQVVIYDTLGHVPMEEDPDLTYFDLHAFLLSLQP